MGVVIVGHLIADFVILAGTMTSCLSFQFDDYRTTWHQPGSECAKGEQSGFDWLHALVGFLPIKLPLINCCSIVWSMPTSFKLFLDGREEAYTQIDSY